MGKNGGRNPSRYPKGLAEKESKLIEKRREYAQVESGAWLGLALSGGGIRSATFSLGILQAMAKKDLLRNVDFLSTVSGGGYIGGFLGRLYTRYEKPTKLPDEDYAADRDGETLLKVPEGNCVADCVRERLANSDSGPLRYLRENGRYLAPSGGGDYLTGVAYFLRNWASLHVMLGLFVVLVMLILTGMELLCTGIFEECSIGNYELGALKYCSLTLSVSALFAVAGLIVGIAYWVLPFVTGSASDTALARRWCTTFQGWCLGATGGLLVLAAVLCLAGWLTECAKMGGWTTALVTFSGSLSLSGVVSLFKTFLFAARESSPNGSPFPLRKIASLVGYIFAFLLLVSYAYFAGAIWNLGKDMCGPRFACIVLAPLCLMLVLLFLVSYFSFKLPFVNQSGQGPLYFARLTRAYLGASNPTRLSDPSKRSVLKVVKGDGLLFSDYKPHDRGGPLHIINTTINETVDGESQVQQQDRRGVCLATGPAGMSVGVQHHALWETENEGTKTRKKTLRNLAPGDSKRFDVFQTKKKDSSIHCEDLDLGRWIATSGAAFTTGMGRNTRTGLSLLLGLANIRLGYWWNSGLAPIDRANRKKPHLAGMLGEVFRTSLPIHSHLAAELLARFRGTQWPHWNLSDGGHFENLGCYELIRRRLPIIFVCDAGADSGYAFEDLGHLVRKARVDLGAEISFLGEKELEDVLQDQGEACKKQFGVLDQLRQGSWSEEPVPDLSRPEREKRLSVNPDQSYFSLAHCTLARVSYADDPKPSLLVLIKLSITGDEPADILHYRKSCPGFPHQSTIDQFFDEAQWESYRRLGEHVGEHVFDADFSRIRNRLSQ